MKLLANPTALVLVLFAISPALAALGAACSGGGKTNAPADGGDADADTDTDSDSDADSDSDSGSDADAPVLHLGVMVHLEGHDVSAPAAYEDYKQQIFDTADIFEAHDAVLTWEVKEQIHACEALDDPFFAELEQRGHGVGVHADAGGVPAPGETWQDLSDTLFVLKSKLEGQGVSVRHVSGYCSPLDWVRAVVEAEYGFVTGGVAYCLMCLPEDQIPAPYADCANPAECHDPYPTAMIDRMHPWTMRVGEPWIEDHADGELVYLPAAVEGLPYLAEIENGEDTADVEFASDDVEVYLEKLQEALANLDPDRVNFFYAAWSFGKAMPESFAEEWLSAIDPYVEAGRVEWKTLPEMYDIFVEWRDANPER